MRSIYAIHLCAPNDSNGNPRRAFAIYRLSGRLVAVYDEGYRGIHCGPERHRKAMRDAPRVAVPAREYRSWLEAGGLEG